jgi:hypothetical protein
MTDTYCGTLNRRRFVDEHIPIKTGGVDEGGLHSQQETDRTLAPLHEKIFSVVASRI